MIQVSDEVYEKITKYIIDSSLMEKKTISRDLMIFENGILDSMGLLFLIEFINEEFGVEVLDEELIPKNFESINTIVEFIANKRQS